MNLIWNAAGDYDWNSPFLAFHPNGDCDDYLNTVIGLSAKWLDRERITDFFIRLGEGPTLDEVSALLWLGIENCVFGKELPSRPVLSRMRKERAEEFFLISCTLSEQQMAFMSIRVYDQELLRWSSVLGRKPLAVSPAALRLAKELEFSPDWNTDEVLLQMHAILKNTFRRTLPDHPPGPKSGKMGALRALAATISRKGERRADLLVLRKGSGTGDAKRSVHITHGFSSISATEDVDEDRDYIEEAFGACMYTDAEMRILENSLCTGNDQSCRLWFTDAGWGARDTENILPGDSSAKERQEDQPALREGKKTQSSTKGEKRIRSSTKGEKRIRSSTKEGRRLWRDQEAQRKRNEEYYRTHLFRIRESIRNLSAQTDTIFQSYLNYLPSRVKQGKLEGERAWRIGVLGDMRVFLADSDPAEASLSVDLLLDASQSRMNSQEMIASQALVIARSFEECHIPVRVTAFRSLRGYTVLQRLKEYGDRTGEGIFRYYAGGWNRDALCLKAMEYLMEEERKQGIFRTRILLVLTDASPNDSVPLPPKEGGLFSREYEGDEPVREAQEAVRKLMSDGIHTGALFYGATSHLEQVHQIYGQQYVRVKTLGQLPDAVCELLRRSLAQAGTSRL